MDPRLIFAAAALAVLSCLAGVSSVAVVLLSLVAPLVAIGWTVHRGTAAAVVATAAGAAALAITAPDALPGYAATVLGGILFARARTSGRSAWRAAGVAVVPFAVLTIGHLAAAGWDPFPQGTEVLLGGILQDSADRLTAEQIAELQASSEMALAFARRTWVASETVWFVTVLAIAWGAARRLFPRAVWPVSGRFVHFDVPDRFVGGLILGLALVLLVPETSPVGEDGDLGALGGVRPIAYVGWNLVFACGVAFLVRGIAIQAAWMEVGNVSRGLRVAFFAVSVVVFLPVYLAITSGLGLFDAWFDFRRLRGGGSGTNPLSIFQPSSGDDQRGAE